jgi:hypothetical protein
MGKRRTSNGSSKKGKGKGKKHRENQSKDNIYQIEKGLSQKEASEYVGENLIKKSVEGEDGDIHIDSSTSNIGTETSSTDGTTVNTTDINDCCEEIKVKQQELLGKIKNLSEAVVGLTLIRDSANSISVDTITELYFTRQVRPLLDALNIISFATSNMSNTATDFQTNAFADKKEIKNALNLSYKMNDEVDDIITALDRRLKIFLTEINKMDKNCPPFYFNKNS